VRAGAMAARSNRIGNLGMRALRTDFALIIAISE
jgi:hypothetical protein